MSPRIGITSFFLVFLIFERFPSPIWFQSMIYSLMVLVSLSELIRLFTWEKVEL